MKSPDRAHILNTLLLSVLSIFFVHSTLAANPCADLNKKIRFAQSTTKNTQEYISDLKEISAERNKYANGTLMKTVRWGIQTSFMFSPSEAKENVENFFAKRLSVDETVQLPGVHISFSQNIITSFAEFEEALQILENENKQNTQNIERSSTELKMKNQRAISKEINEIIVGASTGSSKGNVEKFGEAARDISDTEVNLATNKSQLRRSQLYTKALMDLQLQARQFCSTQTHLGSLNNAAIELNDAETQSAF